MKGIELREVIFILRKRMWVIILITILFVAASGVISYFILEPEYEAYTTLVVGKSENYKEKIEYDDLLVNEKLITTYSEIAKSRLVSNELIKNMKLDLTEKELEKKINVTLIQETEIIKISVKDKDPVLASNIANEISNVFIKHITTIMKLRNIQVIDRAQIPIEPVNPKPILNMSIAGILGLMIGVFLVFFLKSLNNKINNPDDIEGYLDLPVIGMIPENI